MNDWKEITKFALLGIIAVTVVYGTFIKKERTRIIRQSQPGLASVPPPQPISQNNPNEKIGMTIDPSKKEGSMSTFGVTSVAWSEETYDFGTIKQHTENMHIFTFTNTGDNPMIIENAQGSCGCTVPEYPKEPIPPGETGEIKVKYSPGTQIGQQQKSVAITANTQPAALNLYITANVEEAPEPVLNE